VNDILYDEDISFKLTVPDMKFQLNAAVHLTVFSAFLIAHHDHKYREAFDILHRISTLRRQCEINILKGRRHANQCPRRYDSSAPFSHFAHGWYEDPSGEEDRGPSSSALRAAEYGRDQADDGDEEEVHMNEDTEDSRDSTEVSGSNLSYEDRLRRRAAPNIVRETARVKDVHIGAIKNPYRTVDTLRFLGGQKRRDSGPVGADKEQKSS
jgi:hypothetical protein